MGADTKTEKGSKYHIQRFVNERTAELNNGIVGASPTLLAFGPKSISWKSPLKDEGYYEYRDDFLGPLGLEEHENALREFWPSQGPQWDGLGVVASGESRGYLLVEAKAHPEETHSASGATAPASVAKIKGVFDTVQAHMGIAGTDWIKGHYQLANRIAFLYWLNVVINVPSWLVLLNFVNDTTYKPTDLSTWIEAERRLFADLGLHPDAPLLGRVITLFLPAD